MEARTLGRNGLAVSVIGCMGISEACGPAHRRGRAFIGVTP